MAALSQDRGRRAAMETGWRLAEEDFGFGIALGRDQLELAGGLGERHADDVGAAQRDHHAERFVVDRLDRVHPEPGSQHPVERRRRAAALDVAEYRAAGLLAGPLLDLLSQHLSDPT